MYSKIIGKEFRLNADAKDRSLPTPIKILSRAKIGKMKVYDFLRLQNNIQSLITYNCIRSNYTEA